MQRMFFLNTFTQDLPKALAFFKGLGFTQNEEFSTDQTGTIMIESNIMLMLHTPDRYTDFTKKEMIDPTTQSEALFCISADSREALESLCHKAFELGAKESSEKQDHGWMLGWGFDDLDGHTWEVSWMDMEAAAQAQQ